MPAFAGRKNNENRVGTRRDSRCDVKNNYLYHCVVTKFRVFENNEIGIADQRILYGPGGAETMESHRSKKLAQAVQNGAIHIGRARGNTLEEIDHRPLETIARASEGVSRPS